MLERQSLVARLSDLTGEPITQLLGSMPDVVSRRIHSAVHRTLSHALALALYKLDSRLPEPGLSAFKVMSGIAGGVSGFFGMATLALELPVTTTLMLRSIGGIARREGEDLERPDSRRACLEVLALGPGSAEGTEASYYATRAFLAKTVSEAARRFAQRGVAGQSSPLIAELITAVGSRFGLVVSEKVAAGAIPVVGAIGGAAINLVFMQHYQQLAEAHFTIRRLERLHGESTVCPIYQGYAEIVRRRPHRRISG